MFHHGDDDEGRDDDDDDDDGVGVGGVGGDGDDDDDDDDDDGDDNDGGLSITSINNYQYEEKAIKYLEDDKSTISPAINPIEFDILNRNFTAIEIKSSKNVLKIE